jgi:four helix bundle protein
MKINRFEDMEVWQFDRGLVKEIYEYCGREGFNKDFGLKNQITRAGVSIMSNIAEGFERKSNKEFTQYLFIAKGSAAEVRTQLYVALDLAYLNESEFKK